MFRPRTLVNLYILNSTEDKLFMAKKTLCPFWLLLGEKLEYGEKFEVCTKRILLEETLLSLEEQRFKFICTFNAVDKNNKKHFLVINYYVKLSVKKKRK